MVACDVGRCRVDDPRGNGRVSIIIWLSDMALILRERRRMPLLPNLETKRQSLIDPHIDSGGAARAVGVRRSPLPGCTSAYCCLGWGSAPTRQRSEAQASWTRTPACGCRCDRPTNSRAGEGPDPGSSIETRKGDQPVAFGRYRSAGGGVLLD